MAFAQSIEQWRLIDGYDNYEVSSHGRVRNSKTNRIMKLSKKKDGYVDVNLCKNSKATHHLVHRLVSFAFCENPNNYNVVDHLDRVRTNNMFNNLRWCTNSQNQRNTTISKNNTSGKTGVKKCGYRWVSSWYDNGNKHQSKSFSVNKYGEEEAKRQAIEYRKLKEIEFDYLN